jgi:hypothetical protein
MPIRFRKTLRFGRLRLNLSRRGVSTTVKVGRSRGTPAADVAGSICPDRSRTRPGGRTGDPFGGVRHRRSVAQRRRHVMGHMTAPRSNLCQREERP